MENSATSVTQTSSTLSGSCSNESISNGSSSNEIITGEIITSSRKRKNKSDVWPHVKRIRKSGKDHLQCNYCPKSYLYSGGSTSSCKNHLETCHPEKLLTNQSDREIFNGLDPFACVEISKLICKNGYSFLSVSKCTLTKVFLFEKFQVKINSPASIRKYVFSFAFFVIHSYKKLISDRKKSGHRFHLIIDEAKLINNIKILGLKLNIIDSIQINLGVIRIQDRSTAANIVRCIEIKLEQFGLQLNDIIVIISDACATMKRVGRLAEVNQQWCYAHLVQLVVFSIMFTKRGSTRNRPQT